jgi:hypothetical protein
MGALRGISRTRESRGVREIDKSGMQGGKRRHTREGMEGGGRERCKTQRLRDNAVKP